MEYLQIFQFFLSVVKEKKMFLHDGDLNRSLEVKMLFTFGARVERGGNVIPGP